MWARHGNYDRLFDVGLWIDVATDIGDHWRPLHWTKSCAFLRKESTFFLWNPQKRDPRLRAKWPTAAFLRSSISLLLP